MIVDVVCIRLYKRDRIYIGENQKNRWIIRGYDWQIQEQARNHVNVLAFATTCFDSLIRSDACMTRLVLYNWTSEHGRNTTTLSLNPTPRSIHNKWVIYGAFWLSLSETLDPILFVIT